MNTATGQLQIRISVSNQLGGLLNAKAQRLGVPLTQFVKHILLTEVKDEEYPVFPASDRVIQKAKKALKERHKAVKITDIHEFFDKS